MKIAMIGSGATGSVFASFLKLGGADVWLVDPYKSHMDAVAEKGLTLRLPDKEVVIPGFHTAYTPENIGTMDVVIILSKTTQSDSAIRGALPCIGSETVALTLQNGLGNAEKLCEYISPSRVMYGSGIIGTELPEPGVCVGKTTEGINLHFGALEKNEVTDRVGRYLVDTFSAGGCLASFDDNIKFFVWRKAIGNVIGNAILGILRMNAGTAWDDPHATFIMHKCVDECAEIANALGMDGESIREAWQAPNLGAMRSYYSSTAQDMLMYKRKTEIDSLNGAIVQYGKKLGISTPYNEFITEAVKAIEENYDKQYKEA